MAGAVGQGRLRVVVAAYYELATGVVTRRG